MLELGPAVVSCNVAGSRPPLVFFHSWNDEDRSLRALAEFLGPEQPLYGLEPPSDDQAMPTNVSGWIAHHRRLFDSLPLEAPYYLAGYSFGGVLALEMARQLRREGAEIGWLGLVDTTRPKKNPKGVRPYLRHHRLEVRALAARHRPRYITRLVLGGAKRTMIRGKVGLNRGAARLHLANAQQPKTFAEAQGLTPLNRSIVRSYLSYEGAPYDGPVTLFVTPSSVDKAWGDRKLRWSRFLTGDVELIDIEGEHRALFTRKNIHSVGDTIRDSLHRCQGMSSTRPKAMRLSR